MNKTETSLNGNHTAIGRIDSLDYLRGISALLILCYHIQLHLFGEADAASFLGKAKIYGVAVFYILSGLTLFKVYINQLTFSKTGLVDFYLKRIFRIYPLMWLSIILSIILTPGPKFPSVPSLIVNFTGLFGFIRPGASINAVTWSIGNELVFYSLFPLFIYLIRKSAHFIYLILGVAAALFIYFSYFAFNPQDTLGHQWGAYVNPLNQVLYFGIGILFGFLHQSKNLPKIAVVLFIPVLAAILFYPVQGDPVMLVIGTPRVVLTILWAALAYFFFNIDFSFLPVLVKRFLQFLGDISYSLYLLHSIIIVSFLNFNNQFKLFTTPTLIALIILVSFFVSYLSYTFFERYFIRLGKRLLMQKALTPVKKGVKVA